jgi:uncharacterized protein involved in outer membrane biogenesis
MPLKYMHNRAIFFSKKLKDHFVRGRFVARKIAYGLAGFLLLVGLLGYFVLPGVILSQAEKQVAERLHRRLTIQKIDVSPYTLSLTVHDLKLMEPDGNTVFVSFDVLEIRVSAQSLLRFAPVVQEVRLDKPYVHLVLLEPHHYNFDDLLQLALNAPAAPSSGPARFAVHNIQIDGGTMVFDDRPKGVSHQVRDLKLGVPYISSLPSQVKVFVEPFLSANVDGTSLVMKGRALPFAPQQEATLNVDLDGIDVPRYLDYLPFKPQFKLSDGKLDVHLAVNFHKSANAAPTLLLKGNVLLKSLGVNESDGTPAMRIPELSVTLEDTDIFSGNFHVGKVTLSHPELNISRDKKGQINLQRMATLQATGPVSGAVRPPTPAEPEAKTAGEASEGHLLLDDFSIQGAQLSYHDAQADMPLKATLDDFNLSVHNAALDFQSKAVTFEQLNLSGKSVHLEDHTLQRPVITNLAAITLSLDNFSTAAGKQGQLQLLATVNKSGHVTIKGSVGINPVQASLALDIQRVDVLPLQPYFTRQLNLLVSKAQVSTRGALQLNRATDGTLKGGFKGNLSLDDVATVDKVNADDFLRWKSLYIGGINARLNPFSLSIEQIALNDFFARIIVNPDGRINLQNIAAASEPAAASGAATPAPAPNAGKITPIKIGKVTLQGGEVKFSDNYIKPNYSADLANLGGIVAGLSSDASTTASVDLRGEVNQAPLNIAGQVNPLTGNLFLDLKANVSGMELSPFSPYSGKYVGYGIEEGKLSFEVNYHVADHVLKAENHLTLDQLTFGEKVESPSATHLPVQLAVALLRDRNGVIDINLPIGGSLDDPQFSVGGILVQVIVNLVTKAVTAPFALIGSLFGGGETLSWMDFDPGLYTVNAAGQEKLKTLAKALNDRPGLKLEIVGYADQATDAEGMRRASIERKVRAIKVKRLADQGQPTDLEHVDITPQEYPDLLTRVYKAEKFPKPRNLIGFEKSLPVPEMEKLMMANAQISDEDLAALANQRAQSTQDWLVKNGQVPSQRIFIVSGKLSEGKEGQEKASPSRVEFSLK